MYNNDLTDDQDIEINNTSLELIEKYVGTNDTQIQISTSRNQHKNKISVESI